MVNLDVEEMNEKELELMFIRKILLNEDEANYIENINVDLFSFYKEEVSQLKEMYIKNGEIDITILSTIWAEKLVEFFNIDMEDPMFKYSSVENVLRRITDNYQRKTLFEIGKELMKDSQNLSLTPEETASKYNIVDKLVNTCNSKKFKEVIPETLKSYEEEDKNLLKTGIKAIDDVVNGIGNSDLFVIGARPGGGKTALALQIVANNLKQDKKALVVSLEMEGYKLGKRLFQEYAYKPNYSFIEDEETRFKVALELSKKYGNSLFILDNKENYSEIMQEMKSIAIREKIDLIVLDYMGLIEPDGESYSREREVAKISRSLKMFTKKYQVPVICLTQLNRTGADGEPDLTCIRESDSLSNDANKVLLLWEKEKLDIGKSIINCKIDKNREGGRGTVELLFHKQEQRITDYK